MVAIPQEQYPLRMTEKDYLAFERKSEIKHEFINGEVFAMSGASRAHNLITMNTGASLHSQLRKRDCEVYPADMRVKISTAHTYTYPDITVVCGKPTFADNEFDNLLNPTVIIEVLSPSTEAYDRGAKFRNYRKIDSLRDYILITQTSPRIERYQLLESGIWGLSDAEGEDAQITIDSIQCTLSLADVYEKVIFEDNEA